MHFSNNSPPTPRLPAPHMTKQLPSTGTMKFSPIQASILAMIFLSLPACHKAEEQHHEEHRSIVVTGPEVKDVTITEQYVCQIHSRRHIEICALEGGYLTEIPVKEGQSVKQGESLFKILPTIYEAKLDSDKAEAQLAQIEFDNTKKLFENRVVSDREVALAQAKLAKAQAQLELSRAELNFTNIKAPFDGIIDRLHEQQGSLIEEGDTLTSLSDNGVMWVYFNVPEARYLEYKSEITQDEDDDDADEDDADDDDEADDDDADADEVDDDRDADEVADGNTAGKQSPVHARNLQVELVLANGKTFEQPGAISAIEGEFNNETGNIAFRADFPNPNGLLRHGQTGSILIHRIAHDAVVIPQRATFEILDKRYVFIVGDDHIAHQREITVGHELEDIFVVQDGIKKGDKFVLEGVRDVRDGEKIEPESSKFRAPEVALSDLKYKAE